MKSPTTYRPLSGLGQAPGSGMSIIEGAVSKGVSCDSNPARRDQKSGPSCHGAVIGSSIALIVAFHECRVGSLIFVPGLTRCVLTFSVFQLQHSNILCLKDHVKTKPV